jgi:hypothetical protein
VIEKDGRTERTCAQGFWSPSAVCLQLQSSSTIRCSAASMSAATAPRALAACLQDDARGRVRHKQHGCLPRLSFQRFAHVRRDVDELCLALGPKGEFPQPHAQRTLRA